MEPEDRSAFSRENDEERARAWLDRNRLAVESFFEGQRRLIDAAAGEPLEARRELFDLAQATHAEVLNDFVETQEFGARAFGASFGPRALSPRPVPELPAAPRADESIEGKLIRAVCELTGFPSGSITRASNVESELGLDSVSMLEIYLRLVDEYPALEGLAPELRSRKTIGELAEFLASKLGQTAAASPAPVPGELKRESVQNPTNGTLANALAGRLASFDGANVFVREDLVADLVAHYPALAIAGRELVHRSDRAALISLAVAILEPSSAAAPERWVRSRRLAPSEQAARPDRAVVFVSGDALSASVVTALEETGTAATAVRAVPGGWTIGSRVVGLDDLDGVAQLVADSPAVIFVASGMGEGSVEALERAGLGVFVLAKALPGATRLTVVLRDDDAPAFTAARGVARTLSRERPGGMIRTIAVSDAAPVEARRLAEAIFSPRSAHDLLLVGPAMHDMWLASSLRRPARGPTLTSRSAVAFLGGGAGITAEAAVAVAERYHCAIAAIGRTPWASKPEYGGESDHHSLKRLIFEQLQRDDPPNATPAVVQARFRVVARQLELHRTRERVERAGGVFHYEQADATDRGALRAALDRVRTKLGPLSGVVHGIGTVEDALVSAKTIESFRRVLYAKARSALHLHEAVKDDPLQFVILMSSLSAHAGTPGQTDYVAANEVLGALARRWNREASYPVRAVLWSVWTETGLASPALKKQLARHHLGGISNADGRRLFIEELERDAKDEDWALIASRSILAYAMGADA